MFSWACYVAGGTAIGAVRHLFHPGRRRGRMPREDYERSLPRPPGARDGVLLVTSPASPQQLIRSAFGAGRLPEFVSKGLSRPLFSVCRSAGLVRPGPDAGAPAPVAARGWGAHVPALDPHHQRITTPARQLASVAGCAHWGCERKPPLRRRWLRSASEGAAR